MDGILILSHSKQTFTWKYSKRTYWKFYVFQKKRHMQMALSTNTHIHITPKSFWFIKCHFIQQLKSKNIRLDAWYSTCIFAFVNVRVYLWQVRYPHEWRMCDAKHRMGRSRWDSFIKYTRRMGVRFKRFYSE